MTKHLLLGLPVLLAACGQPAPAPTNTAAASEQGYIAKVRALAPGQRAAMLFGAIQKSGGKSCQGVTKVENLAATDAGQPAWRATCAEGSQWLVTLHDDGTALVTGASDAVHLNR